MQNLALSLLSTLARKMFVAAAERPLFVPTSARRTRIPGEPGRSGDKLARKAAEFGIGRRPGGFRVVDGRLVHGR